MHRWLGHRRVGGIFFRNHIKFHHTIYAKGHLVSSACRGEEGNNTPYFLIPTGLLGLAAFLVLPLGLFLTLALAAAASFYAHVHLDKAYHVKGSWLERFTWFRRKRQLHFVHHLHSNCNFAVIDFFWDRLLPPSRRRYALLTGAPVAGAVAYCGRMLVRPAAIHPEPLFRLLVDPSLHGLIHSRQEGVRVRGIHALNGSGYPRLGNGSV
jgi:hypothetical protein